MTIQHRCGTSRDRGHDYGHGHGHILGLGQMAAAKVRQNNDLKLPLLLSFEEGEGRDGQKRARGWHHDKRTQQ